MQRQRLPRVLLGFIVLLLVGAVVGVALYANQAAYPDAPACRVDPQHLEAQTSANAGCAILFGGALVTTVNRASGKLDLPGGTANAGELAQCTAHRETWANTVFA